MSCGSVYKPFFTDFDCGCGCSGGGLSGLGLISPTSMESPVGAGTVVEWQGYITQYGVPASINEVREVLYFYLDPNVVPWDKVQVTAQRGSTITGAEDSFFSIRVTSATDRAQLQHIYYDVEQALRRGGLNPLNKNYNLIDARNVNPAATLNPNTGGLVYTPNANGAPDDSDCSMLCGCGKEWSWTRMRCVPIGTQEQAGLLDSLARQLGVTYAQAAAVGGIAVIAGLVFIKRII